MNIKNNKKSRDSICKIKDALSCLIATKGHECLTIKEICEKSKINRSTFYSHFDNIEDALYQICEEYIMNIFKVFLDTSIHYRERLKQGLIIIKNKITFFEYVFTNVKNLELRVMEIIENNWWEMKSFDNFEKAKLSLAFIISGLLGVGKTYFYDRANQKSEKISIDEFADLIYGIIYLDNPYFIIK